MIRFIPRIWTLIRTYCWFSHINCNRIICFITIQWNICSYWICSCSSCFWCCPSSNLISRSSYRRSCYITTRCLSSCIIYRCYRTTSTRRTCCRSVSTKCSCICLCPYTTLCKVCSSCYIIFYICTIPNTIVYIYSCTISNHSSRSRCHYSWTCYRTTCCRISYCTSCRNICSTSSYCISICHKSHTQCPICYCIPCSIRCQSYISSYRYWSRCCRTSSCPSSYIKICSSYTWCFYCTACCCIPYRTSTRCISYTCSSICIKCSRHRPICYRIPCPTCRN